MTKNHAIIVSFSFGVKLAGTVSPSRDEQRSFDTIVEKKVLRISLARDYLTRHVTHIWV